LIRDFYVLIFGELVSFDQTVSFHDLVADRTEALLPDAIAALGVE
jgi:hypothetical protein